MSKSKLTVADFFCGAGGFSEGFRQKGFEVIFALDNWQPAVLTHKFNHPNCKTICMNILELDTPEKIDHYVPNVDVIIGGPPCVSFSGSNRAGKADKSLGIKLIESYLRIIAWKKKTSNLKYWILENVPNASNYIKDVYTWDELNLPGKGPDLVFNQKSILNAAEYGTPQARKRFFGGNFPLPEPIIKNKFNFKKLKNIQDSLTNPLGKRNKHKIQDPNYDFSIDSSLLTDHFYDTQVADYEWKRAKRLKVDHGFMGKMSFPEDVNRPSRTVMATRSASTRESMIFSAKNEKNENIGYRLPTIREVASLMSFPITYQFNVKGEESKYRLVGNAVCVKISAALAEVILKKEELVVDNKFKPDIIKKTIYDLTGTKRKIKAQKNKRYNAKFAQHIPTLKIKSFRIDLTNIESNFKEREIKWTCILHHGTGKKASKCNSAECELERLTNNITGFDNFKAKVKKTFTKHELTHIKLQNAYINVNSKSLSPDKALDIMLELIEKHFQVNDIMIDNKTRTIKIERDKIPLKIIAGLYVCDYFVRCLKKE